MKQFKDATGKQWTIEVNLASIEVVKEICKVDLTKVFGDDLQALVKLFDDPKHLAEVLLALIGCTKSNFDKNGVDRVAFLTSLRGDSLEEAANALVDDVIDFFPPRKRKIYRETVTKLWEQVDQGQVQAIDKIQSMDLQPEIRKLLNSATNSAESSASTPGPLPSGNSV